MDSGSGDVSSGSSGFHHNSIRLPSLPQRLEVIERIMTEAIADPLVKKYRRRALFTFFCGEEPQSFAGYEGQLEVVGRCLEWFVFDYTIPEINTTPAIYWFKKNSPKLNPDQRNEARNCLDFVVSLFEVTQVKPNEGFVAVDLLRPPLSYGVQEKIITLELREGQLLLGRIFPQDKYYLLSGMVALMNEKATKKIKYFIQIGQLKPQFIVKSLDGLELENFFGRSTTDIETIQDLEVLHRRLRHYLDNIYAGQIEFTGLIEMIKTSHDPFSVTDQLRDELCITCRHELELILEYVMATWYAYHQV
jgi:hypothetical protein